MKCTYQGWNCTDETPFLVATHKKEAHQIHHCQGHKFLLALFLRILHFCEPKCYIFSSFLWISSYSFILIHYRCFSIMHSLWLQMLFLYFICNWSRIKIGTWTQLVTIINHSVSVRIRCFTVKCDVLNEYFSMVCLCVIKLINFQQFSSAPSTFK